MPDPLAPIRPGDPIATVLAANRHNAYAHAARILAGGGPVRWARRKRPRRGGKLFTVCPVSTLSPPAGVSPSAEVPVYRCTRGYFGDWVVDDSESLQLNFAHSQRRALAGIGYDEGATANGITVGLATMDKGVCRLVDWPTEFLVHLQTSLDTSGSWVDRNTNPASVKYALIPTPYVGDYGDAFDARLGAPWDGATDVAWTVNAPADSFAQLVTFDYGLGWEYGLRLDGLTDEPYDTIRPVYAASTPGGTGPCHGWLWCDGTNGTPDLRDRFLVGGGTGSLTGRAHNFLTPTGGFASHGGDDNAHPAHDGALADHDHTLASVQEGSGGFESVASTAAHTHTWGPTHGAAAADITNNEPPWHAVMFAIRKKLVA